MAPLRSGNLLRQGEPLFDRVGIVGVGLIGASIGLALKQRKLCSHVLGIGRSATTMDVALRLGAVDDCAIGFTDAIASLDLLVVCTPVDKIVEHVEQSLRFLPAQALITDAGSTKATIVRQIESLDRARHRFVGSHPLAGSEKSGPSAGRPDLFIGRTCVVTPVESTSSDAAWKIRNFWIALGMRVIERSPEEHDRLLGLTSHLPHLVASALAGTLEERHRPFTGTGFRDTTRIAAGDPAVWTAIFQSNRSACLEALAEFRHRLNELEAALQREDQQQLRDILQDAKQRRDALGS